jgi:hypothetical protein
MIMIVLPAIKNVDFNFQLISVYDRATIDMHAVAIQKLSTEVVTAENSLLKYSPSITPIIKVK